MTAEIFAVKLISIWLAGARIVAWDSGISPQNMFVSAYLLALGSFLYSMVIAEYAVIPSPRQCAGYAPGACFFKPLVEFTNWISFELSLLLLAGIFLDYVLRKENFADFW